MNEIICTKYPFKAVWKESRPLRPVGTVCFEHSHRHHTSNHHQVQTRQYQAQRTGYLQKSSLNIYDCGDVCYLCNLFFPHHLHRTDVKWRARTFTPRDTKRVAPMRRKNAKRSGNSSKSGLSKLPILDTMDLKWHRPRFLARNLNCIRPQMKRSRQKMAPKHKQFADLGSRVKFFATYFLIVSLIIASKYWLQAFPTDAAPMIYSRIMFQPTENAIISPIVA